MSSRERGIGGILLRPLAVSIRAHAAARTVAQIFWTAHRAGESRRMQNALSAHAAVEDRFLRNFFCGKNDAFKNLSGVGFFFQERHRLTPTEYAGLPSSPETLTLP